MLALSAVAVRRGSRRVAEPAPFSVAPARFPFPAPAAGSWAQRGPWVEQAAARPSAEPAEQDGPEGKGRQPVMAGTVLPRAAEHEVSVLPRAVEHAASAPQAAEHAERLGEGAVAVGPVAGGGGGGQGGAAGGAGGAGGAAFGCSFGGCLGFPSGPTSSRACATTNGAVCAWDGAAANWMAVRAVVASNKSRTFVMMAFFPGKFLARRVCQQALAI